MGYLMFVLGAIIGTIVTYIANRRGVEFGVLKIDRSYPEKDVYRIELDDLDMLAKKKRIILKVDADANLSHK